MLYSYRELRDALDNLSDEQLDQQVQIMLPDPDGDKILPMHPGISFNTIKHFLDDQKTRSSVDNEHHEEDLIILVDWNMYADDGSIGFDLMTGERIMPKK